MYSIQKNVENTIIIKKSKFICKLYRINNLEEINNILEKLKKEYNDSTHICYAYIIDSKERCNDNGEPSGTAGMPMLNVLKKNNLDHILAVVIRYFGGIKLGAGGLTRAYSNSTIEAINNSKIIELVKGFYLQIEFDFSQKKTVDYILNNISIKEITFDTNIIYKLYLSNQDIINELKNNVINLKTLEEVYIEKM